MLPQCKAKIFIADERGVEEDNGYRKYSTFSHGKYTNGHKVPFGNLRLLNEVALAGSQRITTPVEEGVALLLLPIVGAVDYLHCNGNSSFTRAGEAMFTRIEKGCYTITNPYENELVSFIQIWMTGESAPMQTSETLPFNLDENRNKLVSITGMQVGNTSYTNRFFIGKFTGRQEAVCTLTQPGNGLFFYVLHGAFEVQYRLLNAGDGLALWELEGAELEALSNEAIILVAEVPLK